MLIHENTKIFLLIRTRLDEYLKLNILNKLFEYFLNKYLNDKVKKI